MDIWQLNLVMTVIMAFIDSNCPPYRQHYNVVVKIILSCADPDGGTGGPDLLPKKLGFLAILVQIP